MPSSAPAHYKELCVVAEARGLHVELYTDHRSKNARAVGAGTPKIAGMRVTNGDGRTLFHDAFTYSHDRLETAAASALDRLGVR